MASPTSTNASNKRPPSTIDNHLEKSRYLINEMTNPLNGYTVSSLSELKSPVSHRCLVQATLDGLHGQTMQIALLGDVGTTKEISE